MKLLLFGISKFVARISGKLASLGLFLAKWGPWGLLLICVLDSTFVPLPSSADLLLILLSTQNPHWMPFYVFLAVLGSTIGCVILYYVSRRAGHRALNRFSPEKQRRVRELIDRYDVLSVLVACLLPPPFPLKLFVVTTGVMRLNVVRFAAAIAAGRAVRYLLLGILAARYGREAGAILAKYYPWIGLGLVALIVMLVVARALTKKRPESVETLEAGN